MAQYDVVAAKHATLTATTVDIVTLSTFGQNVEVLNKTGAADLNVLIGVGTTAQAATSSPVAAPTANGDNTLVIPAGGSLLVPLSYGSAAGFGGGAIVKIIGNGNAYSVCAA